jgi:hypothetical protein
VAAVTDAYEAIDRFLEATITADPHPDIASVSIAPEPTAYCRVRVDFRDGSAIFIGVGG